MTGRGRPAGIVVVLPWALRATNVIVAVGRQVQIWRAPPAHKQVAPLSLLRKLTGHFDDVPDLARSLDPVPLVTASLDATARVHTPRPVSGFVPVTLSGPRGRVRCRRPVRMGARAAQRPPCITGMPCCLARAMFVHHVAVGAVAEATAALGTERECSRAVLRPLRRAAPPNIPPTSSPFAKAIPRPSPTGAVPAKGTSPFSRPTPKLPAGRAGNTPRRPPGRHRARACQRDRVRASVGGGGGSRGRSPPDECCQS